MPRTTVIVGAALWVATLLAGCGGAKTSSDSGVVAKGAEATIDGLTYRVVATEAENGIVSHVGDRYTPEKGVFLVVELSLANRGGGSARAVGEYLALVGGDGRRYAVDEDGSSAFDLSHGPRDVDRERYDAKRPTPIVAFFEVPAGGQRAASAVFDVPRDAVAAARLEVRGFDGSRTVLALGS
jgi:hypothetical protein